MDPPCVPPPHLKHVAPQQWRRDQHDAQELQQLNLKAGSRLPLSMMQPLGIFKTGTAGSCRRVDETPLSAAFIRAPQRNGVIQQIQPEAPFLAVWLELLWCCSGSNVGLFIDQTSLWFHILFMNSPATSGSRSKTSVDMYICPHITVLRLLNRSSDPGLTSKNLDKDV